MTRAAIAYIRRSSQSRSDPGDISREFQTETVRALAGRDANLVMLDGDWGKSAATDATDKRLAFLGLMASVERGEVGTIYAYSTDRLARSVEWAARLLNACRRAGVTIVTNEGRFEPDNHMTDQLFYFQAMNNEGYSQQQKRKRASTIERQRARGLKLGAPFYGKLPGEDLPAVLAAFDEAGSYSGAARLLNARGVPSRRGHWGGSSIHRIIGREYGRQLRTVRGAKPRADHTLYRLLRCHCGRVLSGSRRSDGTTVYRCIRAENEIGHGKQSVAERPVLEWARSEMARLRPPAESVALGDAKAERHALELRLEKLRTGYLDGLYEDAWMREEKARIDDLLMQLDLRGRAVQIPPFDWDHEPRDLNLALRSLWDFVQLDRDLHPVRAQWLVPDSWLAQPRPRSPAAPQG